MLRRIYDWTLEAASRPYAIWVLAAVSFAESSVFPIPVDAFVLPMVLASRERAWLIGLVATTASVLGGLAGYGIGFFLFETVGRPILEFYGMMAQFGEFREMYNDWGAWIVFGAGLTPFPYKVITIASGVTQLDVATFVVSSVLARGLRFFAEVALLYFIGPPIRDFVERRLALVTTLTFVLLIGGFVMVRYVF